MLNGEENATRDRGHALIGAIWLFTALVSVALGVLALVPWESPAAGLRDLLAGSWSGSVTKALARNLPVVGYAHLLLAAASGASGLGLLRGWRWAPALTIGLCYLSVAYALLGGAHMLGAWWAATGILFADEGPLVYQVGGASLLVLVTVALIVPLPIMARYLRRAA